MPESGSPAVARAPRSSDQLTLEQKEKLEAKRKAIEKRKAKEARQAGKA